MKLAAASCRRRSAQGRSRPPGGLGMDDALATTMPSLEACNIHTGTLLATTSKDHAGMVLAGEAGDEKRHEKTPFGSEGG